MPAGDGLITSQSSIRSSVLMVKDPSPYLTNHVAVHMEKEVLGRGRANGTDIVELN
jgi:hypothetical protein